MRTKALLGLVALAASALTVAAQGNVYSLNIVGYVNVPLAADKFTMVANPLNATPDNNITNVMTGATIPENTSVYTFNGTGYNDPETYYPGIGWYPGTTVLDPGMGFFIKSPSAYSVTFVGEVKTGATSISIPSGFSMKGAAVPQALPLGDSTTDPATTFAFPAADQDTVYRWTATGYSQPITYYTGIGWYDANVEGGGPTVGPTIQPAEGFFISTTAAKTWTRTFNP